MVEARDANDQPVSVNVYWKRDSTYLGFNGNEHLVHPSNLKRTNGFAIEATLVFHLKDAVYRPC